MSEADPTEREWHIYLKDMINYAHKVQSYTAGLERAAFVAGGFT